MTNSAAKCNGFPLQDPSEHLTLADPLTSVLRRLADLA